MEVKRIAIDQIFEESVELEVASLCADIDPEEFAQTEHTNEDLDWWDSTTMESKSLAEFRSQMGLSDDDPLVEGMVFWVSFEEETVTAVQHVTQMVRAAAKELYDRLNQTGF